MKIAYVRVSTVEQNEARQIEALKKYRKGVGKGRESPAAASND